MARRANLAAEGNLPEKADDRFDAAALATLSRIFAREAAMKVGQDGLRWILGADNLTPAEIQAFESQLNLTAIYQTQTGYLEDMDEMGDRIYQRNGF